MKAEVRFAKGREKSICTKFDKLVSKKRIIENLKSKKNYSFANKRNLFAFLSTPLLKS